MKLRSHMIKVWCPICGYTLRTTHKWLVIAIPECPDQDCRGYRQEMTIEEALHRQILHGVPK